MFELVLRIGFSLLVVLGLMWVLAKLARRPLSGGRAGEALAVLTRQQLSRGASVAVVRVADKAMILGVTDGQVTLLGEAELAAFERQNAPAERRDAVAVDDAAVVVQESRVARLHAAPSRLDGSMLSPKTWTSTLEFLKERTVRR